MYTELPAVDKLSELEPGGFYFCVITETDISGEDVLDIDMVHIAVMDVKFAGQIKKGVKVVQFSKGRVIAGQDEKRHTCRLDQLPKCTFHGPMKVEVSVTEVGDVLEEIAE